MAYEWKFLDTVSCVIQAKINGGECIVFETGNKYSVQIDDWVHPKKFDRLTLAMREAEDAAYRGVS